MKGTFTVRPCIREHGMVGVNLFAFLWAGLITMAVVQLAFFIGSILVGVILFLCIPVAAVVPPAMVSMWILKDERPCQCTYCK